MRKFARIKTKLISCILLLAMGALFLASANHVQADQEYLSFDQYKAEHYINYSSYEYFMSDDFKMPYRTTVEKDRSSATFNSLLAAWEVATFSGSNVVEMANKRKGYYEAFLFDIIYTGTDAVNVTDSMNAGIKATQASVLSKVTKLMDEGYYKDIDVRKLTEESYAKLVSGLEKCGEFNDIFSAVNNVGKYVQYANDIETLVYRMAKIEAICGQSKEYAEVLRDMSKNTTDETLAAACDEMASICDGVMSAKLMDAIMTGEEVVTNVSKWVTDKIWDCVIDSLGVCGIGITAGQAVGKWASGVLFSTDKTIETYYEMSALYNFDNAIRKVVKDYEQQYSRYSSDSVEYAKKFNASVELMLKTQELGCDISIKDAEYKYEKGVANVFVSRFNGKKEAMASYKKSLQGIKKNISFIYTFANGDLYNCYKDEYCSNVSDDLGMTDVSTTDDGSSASKADEKQVTQELIRTAEACCKKEINEPMKLTGNVTYYGDVYVSSDLNLNGYKCTVYGNLIQSSGTLTLNGGTLDVSGDYRMEEENVDSTGNISYSYGSSMLFMTNSDDIVNVGGTFENNVWGVRSYNSDLQAGIMSVKGDFICKVNNGFCTGGTHKVILNGTGVQKVQIADGGTGFNELDIQNDNVVFIANTYMKGFKANHDITLNVSQGQVLSISGTLDLNGHTLYAPGNLTLTGNGVNVKGGSIVVDGNLNLSCDVNLGGGKLQVKGNLIQSDDILTVAGGTVDVSGDYRMENENVDSTGNVSYSDCSAELNMTNASDCVNVGGTFEFDASNGDLTDGIICIKKDFIIKSEYWRFNPTGNHTIKLDGDKVQKIQIDNSSNNKINNLYLTKDKSTGYNFVTDNCWNKLYLKTKVDKVTVSPELKDVCQGEQIQYSAQVSGVNSPSQAVTWSVTGAKSADTHIEENGLLSVAKDETASNIVIKAVSAEDSSKTASQTVNITKRVPRVDAVRLSANTASMCPGDTHKFSAAVLGENDISQEVVWSVTGQQSADTKVAKDGTLTVGKDESADNISVVATSAVNNKVSASVKIQIVHIIIDSGVDQVAIVVKCGGSLSFEAHIVGINLSSDAVTWSVSNNTSKATSISQEGVLTVGEDEKAATLIVTATSVADPTKSASVNVKVEGSDNAKVVGYSVGISDMISLNMYTYVPEKFLSDAGATAVFTLADGTVTQQPLSEFKKASYNGVNTVVINTKMVPAYITRSVTMKIVGSDGKESEGFTYSIYEYAKDYIKYATTETEYQKALPLVKAMLDYGAYSQLFFGVDASNLANYDRVSNLKLTEGNVEQTACDSVFNAITNEETGTLGNEELIYQNISLICESETSMKLYFQNKNNLTLDQIKEKYAIKVYDSEGNVIPDDGCEMQVEGGLFWIKIKNIGPVKLSSDYTVEFTSDAGTQRGTVSPICYIKKAMKQDDMNLQNLCKAMYLYNKATLEYIGQ